MDLDALRVRLQQEENHLKWFLDTGQTMNSAEGGTQQYVKNIEATIADLKARIAQLGKSSA